MFLSESYLTCSVSQTVVPLDPEEKCSRMEAFPNKNGSYPYSHGPVHPPQKTSWTASEFLGHKKTKFEEYVWRREEVVLRQAV